MATWNDLPFEVKSQILEIIIVEGIEAAARSRCSSNRYIPALLKYLWPALDILLHFTPDLHSETRRIAHRYKEAFVKVVKEQHEEGEECPWEFSNYNGPCAFNHEQLDIVGDLLWQLGWRPPADQARSMMIWS